MERSLRKVIQDVPIGKLLIQTDPHTNEPQLHYCKLPADIASRQVILMDATIATGAAVIMAIRVLMEHSVPEDQIKVVCLVGAPQGVVAAASMFPRVVFIVGEIDWAGLSEQYWILPGVGNFGDRYFGTD